MVEAPKIAIGEKGGAAGFRTRCMSRIKDAARPIALFLLRGGAALGHRAVDREIVVSVRVILRKIVDHHGQRREDPAIASRPEVLFAIH